MAAASFSSRIGLAPYAARRDRAARWIAIGVAATFHVGLCWLLLTHAPARNALRTMAPIVIGLIVPSGDPPPRSTPPPKSFSKPPLRPVQARVEAPAIAPPHADAPAPLVTPPPPVPISPRDDAVVASDPAPAAPAPTIPPRFNADYLQNPAPPYPPLARRMREQGKVILRVLVDANGLPEAVEVRTSSGSARLDQSARDTVRTWKFVAARQGERSVAAWVLVPITFTLES